jgi:hypothetical protein
MTVYRLARLVAALSACLLLSAQRAHAGDWAVRMESPQFGYITTFASRADGTFVTCKVDGNDPHGNWFPTSHGKPGSGSVGQVSAHYRSTSIDFYAFTRTVSGNLYLRYAPMAFNDSTPSWSWHNLGKPQNASIASDPSSASYAGFEYAFVVGSDQHLHSVRGAPWVWSDHGTPGAGIGLVGRPTTIVYGNSLYTFIVGTDGQLYLRSWNGIAWSWVSAGTPNGTLLEGSAAAVTRGNTIQVFVGGVNDHLYLREWTGSLWQWSDRGAADLGIRIPDAAWLVNQGSDAHLYSFAMRYTSADPGVAKLLESHWNAADGWELMTHGAPGQPLLARQPAIAASFSEAQESSALWRVNVFVPAQGDRIYRRIWAPSTAGVWQWRWSSEYCQM